MEVAEEGAKRRKQEGGKRKKQGGEPDEEPDDETEPDRINPSLALTGKYEDVCGRSR